MGMGLAVSRLTRPGYNTVIYWHGGCSFRAVLDAIPIAAEEAL
jgi:hypothetical protein